MLDLLRSKGVRVNEDRNGFKADGEEGLMKYWMVRLKAWDDDMYMFCCGFDMLGDGKLVISHKEYPMDENVFESLQDAIKRNEGKEYSADQILLMPDLDYYDGADAPREDDDKEREDLINKLSAVDSYLNVIMSDIEKAAPIVMDYCNQGRQSKSTVRDRFEYAKKILSDVMNEA